MKTDLRFKRCKIMKIDIASLFDMALKHVGSNDFPEDAKLMSCSIDPQDPVIVMMKISSKTFEKTKEGYKYPVFIPSFRETNWENIARELWKILDDISTLGDACKYDIAEFCETTLKYVEKRGDYMYSPDGHELKLTEK